MYIDMKRLKILVLAVIGLLCSVSVSADGIQVDGFYYNITSWEDKTVEVTYRGSSYFTYSNEYSGAVTIPESVTYNGSIYSVTSIGEYAFRNCSDLTSVVIPNSVTYIGDYAFARCSGLTSVVIPNSVTSIGDYAFYDCDGFTSVVIPNSVTSIGNSAFEYCSGLTSVEIPNSVTRIGDGAFSCSGLTSVDIPESVISIGRAAFYGCYSLTSVVIPEGVTSIEEYTFSGCQSLTSVVIPNSVTRIGDWAFDSCQALTSITIGSGVTSIGFNAFRYCGNLTYVNIEDIAAWCKIKYEYDSSILFDKYSSPFYYAKEFYVKGQKVTNLVIPDGVTRIGDGAFAYCSGLTSVTIPESVTEIGELAFDGCTGLTSVYIDGIAAWCNIEFADVTSNPLCYAKNLYLNGKLVTDLVIPNGVPCIHNYAFYNCDCLTSVLIYNNATTSIGDRAFMNCDGFTSVVMGNKVTSIGAGAFMDCSRLTSVDMGKGVTSIGAGAFMDCSRLTSVNIYDIAAWCNIDFYDANSSNPSSGGNLYLNGKLVTELVIPHGVSSIKKYAFDNCKNLTSVEIPNSVTSIGESSFSSCYGLTSVEIPNSVTSIGSDAFSYCSSLTSLVIPNSVSSIGKYAFYGCKNILDIYAKSHNPVSANKNIFSSATYTTATLHIPFGCQSIYEATSPWNNFYIAETDFTDINDVRTDKKGGDVFYDLNGRVVKNPTKGVYIVNGKKVLGASKK